MSAEDRRRGAEEPRGMNLLSAMISLLFAIGQTCDAAVPLLRRMAPLAGGELANSAHGIFLDNGLLDRQELQRSALQRRNRTPAETQKPPTETAHDNGSSALVAPFGTVARYNSCNDDNRNDGSRNDDASDKQLILDDCWGIGRPQVCCWSVPDRRRNGSFRSCPVLNHVQC